MTRDQFLARLESLAQAHEPNDCECITCMGENKQARKDYRAGYLQGARDAFEECRGICDEHALGFARPYEYGVNLAEAIQSKQAELLGGDE